MFQFALSKLIRGNEIELAVSIGMVLKDNSQIYHLAVELLARKCEKLGKWYPIYLFIYLFILSCFADVSVVLELKVSSTSKFPDE